MRYVTRVIVVFGEGTAYPNTFDAWDTIILLDADRTRSALQSAVSIARSIFENPANQKVLGYSTKPTLYSVASVSRHHDLKCGKLGEGSCRLLVTDMMSLTEADVQKMRAKHDISVSLRTLYVAQA
jgi:hypothetical protein